MPTKKISTFGTTWMVKLIRMATDLWSVFSYFAVKAHQL